MAVNMNPTNTAISSTKAGSLVMRPTQVASVSNVDEPEETLDNLTAVAPEIKQQDPNVVLPSSQSQDTSQEPQVIPEVPSEAITEPVEITDEEPQMFDPAKPVAHASPEESEEYLAEMYGDIELAAEDDSSIYDIELDTESDLVKETYELRNEKKAQEVANKTMVGAKESYTADDMVKVFEGSKFSALQKAKEEYSSWENIGKRFALSTLEFPRYLATMPDAAAVSLTSAVTGKDFKKATTMYERALRGDGLLTALTSWAYDNWVTDPVYGRNGKKTVDQKFENDLISDIEKEHGVKLEEDYLFWQGMKEAGGTAVVGGVLSGFKTLTKEGAKRTAAGLPQVGKTEATGFVVNEGVKAGTMAVASVAASAKALEVFHPESAEGKLLVGMSAGTAAPVALSAANAAMSKVVPYTLSGMAIRVSRVVLNKVPELHKNLTLNRETNKIMRVEGVDYPTALRRYYERKDAQDGSTTKELAFRLLNDTEMTESERLDAVNTLINAAVSDPYSREAAILRAANQTLGKDIDSLGDAWTQADLLSSAFDNEDFKVTAMDMYQGKYTEEFVNLHQSLNADTIVKDQVKMLDLIRGQLQKATDLSDLERGELSLAAKTLEKSIQEHMQSTLTEQQANVAAALDYHTGMKYDPNAPATDSLTGVRGALEGIKGLVKGMLRTGYASIDSLGVHRSTSAYKEINNFLEGMDRANPAYSEIKKAFSSLTADSVGRIFGETNDPTLLITGAQKNPTSLFSPAALNATDALVYLTPEQFTTLTGVKVSKEPKKAKTSIAKITSIKLRSSDDGAFVVEAASDAKLSAGLGQSSLIPVSFNSADISPEGLIRINDQSGSVIELNVKQQLTKTGDDRHNIALTQKAIVDARKKGNLSTEGPFSSLFPKFDSTKLPVSYMELDQFQRRIRKLRRDAQYALRTDEASVYEELNGILEQSIQHMLKDDPDALNNRKLMDTLYGDSFIPNYEAASSLVGLATAKEKNRTYKAFTSAVLRQTESVPELRQKLLDVLNPETSKFMRDISSKDATGKLQEALKMNEGKLRELATQGKTVASSMLDIKLTDILANTYKVIGTDKNPSVALVESIKALKESPDFQALYMASQGTDSAKMIDVLLNLPDDADLNGVLKNLQDHIDRFDSLMYKDVSAMKDPANTGAVLNLVSNIDKLDEVQADLIINGDLGKAAPHMIKIVMEDALKMSDDGLSVASIDAALRKYEKGLERLPGGADAILQLKTLKGAQGVLSRLNATVGKGKSADVVEHNTVVDRVLGWIPSVFSDFRSANKGITSYQFAAVSSVVNIAKGEYRALKKTEQKAATELIVAALRDKGVYERVMQFDKSMKDASPAERLRGLSLMFHAANGARLGALEAMITYSDPTLTDEERREALHNSPEYKEVEAEDLAAEQASYGNRPDGTPKGKGFLGELKTTNGDVMTELSFSVELDGKEVLMPAIVPTLSKSEIKHLQETQEITPEIQNKAVDHAMGRIKEGKSPFYEEGEQDKPKEIPKTLQRPESQMEASDEAMSWLESMAEPETYEYGLAGPITDDMDANEAAFTKQVLKFSELRSAGYTKERVVDMIKSMKTADNQVKDTMLEAAEEAYRVDEKPTKYEEN
jgi:hypothetical protein